MLRVQTKILRALRSPQFFAAVLLLFFVESAWVAISAAYPMVFDENVHFGVIKLYAHQWSPFFPAHSGYVEPFGALASDPSILYRYLMSFPYRLVAMLTSDQTMQVIDLRFINIFLFGSSLILFRRLLLKTRVSAAIVHASLLLFVLIPIVPLLAGQINYDNLVLPITALVLLSAVSISEALARRELPVGRIIWLLTWCLLGSLTQFEFLPIFAAAMLWLLWRLVGAVRSESLSWLRARLKPGWRQTPWRRKLVIGLPLIIALGLFAGTYGANLARYHTLLPACDRVLTARQCGGSGGWVRAQAAVAHRQPVNANPLVFGVSWLYRMFVAMFYTSSGGASSGAYYLSINPLPLIFITALAVFAAGVLLLIRYGHAVFKNYRHFGLLLFICLFYVTALWIHNYADYLSLGQKVAINGRYLLPVTLPFIVVLGLAFRYLLQTRTHLKATLFAVLVLLFLQGGGALTYITVSNQSWYWQNRGVVGLNNGARAVVRPLILVKTPLPSLKLK